MVTSPPDSSERWFAGARVVQGAPLPGLLWAADGGGARDAARPAATPERCRWSPAPRRGRVTISSVFG